MRKYVDFQIHKNTMNPLLENHELPQFSEIKPADIEPAIDNVLEQNKLIFFSFIYNRFKQLKTNK